MKIINFEELLANHKPKGYISNDANDIANKLICECCIQTGSGLARFLNVDSCFDNYTAVRVWVQRHLDTQDDYIINEMRSRLKGELYELVPQSSC